MSDPRISVVVLTHNRPRELERCLQQLTQLPEQPSIIVVDNASQGPGTALVLRHFPQVQRIRSERNLGAAARNLGVGRVRTRYVAFCDDDGWWAPGALARAADLMDGDERIGLVAASVRVGEAERLDPACLRMAQSEALLGFMAGAAVMRTRAFRSTGGFDQRLFLGGEEALMALDLATRDWRMVYAPQVCSYHHPSPLRDAEAQRRLRVRNRVWVAWLRLPPVAALQETWAAWREAHTQHEGWRLVGSMLRGLGWVLAERRRVSAPVHAMWQAMHAEAPPAPLLAPAQEAWR